MYRILLTGLVALSFLFDATAQTARKELPGYGKLLFGMSEQQARNVQQFVKVETEELGVRLTAGEPVVVDEETYELSVLLQRGSIASIHLSNTKDADTSACVARWKRALSSVQKRYGPPDRPVSQKGYGPGTKTLTSDFTFKDGNRIDVLSVFINPSLCFAKINYFRKGAGKPTK